MSSRGGGAGRACAHATAGHPSGARRGQTGEAVRARAGPGEGRRQQRLVLGDWQTAVADTASSARPTAAAAAPATRAAVAPGRRPPRGGDRRRWAVGEGQLCRRPKPRERIPSATARRRAPRRRATGRRRPMPKLKLIPLFRTIGTIERAECPNSIETQHLSPIGSTNAQRRRGATGSCCRLIGAATTRLYHPEGGCFRDASFLTNVHWDQSRMGRGPSLAATPLAPL